MLPEVLPTKKPMRPGTDDSHSQFLGFASSFSSSRKRSEKESRLVSSSKELNESGPKLIGMHCVAAM